MMEDKRKNLVQHEIQLFFRVTRVRTLPTTGLLHISVAAQLYACLRKRSVFNWRDRSALFPLFSTRGILHRSCRREAHTETKVNLQPCDIRHTPSRFNPSIHTHIHT